MTNYNCEAGPTSREDIDRREMTNIKAKVSRMKDDGSELSVSWDKETNRYHIWVDQNGSLTRPVLYKNPPIWIRYGMKGYFTTRLLNPFAKVHKSDVEFALKSVDLKAAVADYHANLEAEKVQREKEAAERKARKQLEATAPRLLEALKDARHRMRNILTEEQLDAAFADGKTIRNQVQMYDDAITEAERKVDE